MAVAFDIFDSVDLNFILDNARRSAERSFFSSSEFSATSSESYSSTAFQPAGLLSAKRISLLRLFNFAVRFGE